MLGRLRAGDARTQRSLRAARPGQRDTRGLPAAHPAATSRRGSAGSACASRCPPSSSACGADGVRGAPGMGRSGAATARGPPRCAARGRTDGRTALCRSRIHRCRPRRRCRSLQMAAHRSPSSSLRRFNLGGAQRGVTARPTPRFPPPTPLTAISFSPQSPLRGRVPPSPLPPPRTRVARFGSVRPGPGAARLGGAAAAETPPERITAGGASSGAGPGGGGTRSRSTRVRALRESRAEPLRRDSRSPVSAASSRWALPFRPWEPPG